MMTVQRAESDGVTGEAQQVLSRGQELKHRLTVLQAMHRGPSLHPRADQSAFA